VVYIYIPERVYAAFSKRIYIVVRGRMKIYVNEGAIIIHEPE